MTRLLIAGTALALAAGVAAAETDAERAARCAAQAGLVDALVAQRAEGAPMDEAIAAVRGAHSDMDAALTGPMPLLASGSTRCRPGNSAPMSPRPSGWPAPPTRAEPTARAGPWSRPRAGVILPCMSMPPGFLDELRERLSLSQVVGRKVVWDSRKSNQAKGDMWAPCPFHQEKTASFHVDDRKGFYYCFGCQAKGDVFTFVRETENVGFMEAVEILAREAGMSMPARDPQAQAKADRRSQLVEVMEKAVRHFRLQLQATPVRRRANTLPGAGWTRVRRSGSRSASPPIAGRGSGIT